MKIDEILEESNEDVSIQALKVWLQKNGNVLSPKAITYEKFSSAKNNFKKIIGNRDAILLYKLIYLNSPEQDIEDALKSRSGEFGGSWKVNHLLKAKTSEKNPRILVASVPVAAVDTLYSLAMVMKDASKKQELKLLDGSGITIVDVWDAKTKKSVHKTPIIIKI